MTRHKGLLLGLAAVMILIILSQIAPLFQKNKAYVLEDYVSEIAQYGSTQNVGTITDEADALAKAEALWVSLYGAIVLKEKPYVVQTDPHTHTYLVKGSLPQGSAGGIAMVILEAGGRVLAVWHTK